MSPARRCWVSHGIVLGSTEEVVVRSKVVPPELGCCTLEVLQSTSENSIQVRNTGRCN